MNYYGEKEIANTLRLLDKMRNEYPKEEEKYKALNIAIDSILNDGIHIMREIDGDTSDGYHTFNELYHHRAILFSIIVKAFPDKTWKSKQHNDGTMYDGMFIVGIDTPEGQATYHYDIDPYWGMFECRELERAPEWDGHTPAQAIERIRKLEPVRHEHWDENGRCTGCGNRAPFWCMASTYYLSPYCQHCGAKMDGGIGNGN